MVSRSKKRKKKQDGGASSEPDTPKKKKQKPAPEVEPSVLLRWSRVTLPLLAVWLVVATIAYWNHADPPGLDLVARGWSSVRGLGNALLPDTGAVPKLALIWALAGLTGRGLLRKLQVDRKSAFDTIALSCGIGMLAFSYGFFVLASIGALGTPGLSLMLVAAAAFGGWSNQDLITAAPWRTLRAALSGMSAIEWVAAALTGGTLLLGLLFALAPEIFYDALVYHLAIPKLHLLEGKLTPTLHNAHEGIPMAVQFFFGVGLWIGGDAVAKLMAWSLAPLCGVALMALAGRDRREAGWVATAVFVTSPLVFAKLYATGNDTGLTFFVLLSVLAASHLLEHRDMRRAVVAGLMVGAVVGTKYTAWAIAPAILVVLLALRGPFKETVVVAGIAGVLLLPWVAKNVLFYGNPIFPIFHDSFTGTPLEVVNWKLMQRDAWGRHLSDQLSSLSGVGTWLISFFAEGWKGHTTPDAAFTGPTYGVFLPLLALFAWPRKVDRLAIGAFLALLVFWMGTSRMLRLFMPGLALLSFLGALALTETARKHRAAVSGLLAVLAVSAVIQVGWAFLIVLGQQTHFVVTRRAERDAFLAAQHQTYPAPSYAAAQYVNENAPKDARVLVLGDSRGFHVDRRFIASSAYNRSPLVLWAEAAESHEALAQRFRDEGVTHVITNYPEGYRVRSRRPFYITQEAFNRFGQFFALHWERKFWNPKTALGVYEVLKEPRAPTSQPKVPLHFEIAKP